MAGGGSSNSKDCSCLCGLVGRYLRQHAEALAPGGRLDESLSSSKPEEAAVAPPTMSKEAEKDLLVSLTLVLREIERWTTEAECDYEQV
ncbi:hypothetical protein Taro_028197 [Colocasia esculenta]|uniref:Uncharacterized protein n=1 Tax=Colocasia esculenta TaxID=4460 RepID=A0A843VHV5_COLES|nr:hypothetical protein [Colocasia esculenta]